MATIGVIFCAYQTEDLLDRSLAPWLDAAATHLGGHTYLICGVSVPFLGFPHDSPLDGTVAALKRHVAARRLHHLIADTPPVAETESRGAALRWLVSQGVEITIMVDSDEFWTRAQIEAAFSFVGANPWIAWFRICYRQMVFDSHQYLAEPFTPARIHRVHISDGYIASGFWDDNNVYYKRPREERTASTQVFDTQLPSLTVPQAAVWVEHETWLSNSRSKSKAAYQRRRWNHCSFKWNETLDRLEWDEAYFTARGEVPPTVLHD